MNYLKLQIQSLTANTGYVPVILKEKLIKRNINSVSEGELEVFSKDSFVVLQMGDSVVTSRYQMSCLFLTTD